MTSNDMVIPAISIVLVTGVGGEAGQGAENVEDVGRSFPARPVCGVVAETEQGRGILGVIDGATPKGVEDEKGIAWRKGFLRKIGYKRQSRPVLTHRTQSGPESSALRVMRSA